MRLRLKYTVSFCAILATGGATGGAARADYTVVYGAPGLTYTQTGGYDGYSGGLTPTGRSAVDGGSGVGFSVKYVSGQQSNSVTSFRWDASGSAIDFQALATDEYGQSYSAVSAANAAEMLAGVSSVLDLNDLIAPNSGWVLNFADDVSDDGWITGEGTYDPDGPGPAFAYNRLFLIHAPLPEPSGAAALLLVTVPLLRRKRHALRHS